MKILFSILLLVSFLYTSLTAVEYGKFGWYGGNPNQISTGSTSLGISHVVLNEGDVLEIVSKDPVSDDERYSSLYFTSVASPGQIDIASANSISWDSVGGKFVGPMTLWAKYNSGGSAGSAGSARSEDLSISYKLTRASEVEYKQANIVSLAADTVGAGTHEIVVEASDDLQTWTPVHSSSIGGNKAFFRTRVVRTGE
jgi:hypothetical protein